MIDLIFSALAKLIAEALEFATNLLLPVFGFTFDTFNDAFPFAAQAFPIFQRIALAITLLIAAWQLFPIITGRIEKAQSSPLRIGLGVILAVGGIYYGNYILCEIIEIARFPFDAFLSINASEFTDFNMGVITMSIADLFYNASMIVYLFMLIMIGFSLLKLLLEAVERYVMMMVLVYLSPLAFCTLASDATNGIFKRYFSMFISQAVLLLLNVWSVKMAMSMLSSIATNPTPILGLLLGYAFLRIAQKLDSYLNQLGLSAAVTGAGLGAELMATGAMVAGMLKGGGAGRFAGINSGGDGNASGVLGLGSRISAAIPKVSPVSAGGDYIRANAQARHAASKKNPELFSPAAAGQQAFAEEMANGDPLQGKISRTASAVIAAAKAGTTEFYSSENAGRRAAALEPERKKAHAARRNPFSDRVSKDYRQGALDAMFSGDVLNSEQLEAFAASPDTAHRAYVGFRDSDASSDEAVDIAAVMQGLGVSKISPAAQTFVDAGYGKISTDSIDYSIDRNGINAEYTQGNKTNRLRVLDDQQYWQQSESGRHGFHRFYTAEGKPYYYHISSSVSGGKPSPDKDKSNDPK